MGRYEDRLRLMLAMSNERGPALYDDPAVLAVLSEWVDPEIECVAGGGVQGGSYRGIDGMMQMVREFTDVWSELQLEVEEVTEAEDRLVATVRYRGRGASSGVPVDEAYVWAQRFEDGKAVSYVIDRDHAAAVRAAGLHP